MLSEIERGRLLASKWLVSKGKMLSEFSVKKVKLSKTLGVLNWISIGGMALSIPALLMEEQSVVDGIRNLSPTVSSYILDHSRSIRLACYIGALIGVSYYLIFRPFAANIKNIQRSTHILPLTARAFQAVGNHLAA